MDDVWCGLDLQLQASDIAGLHRAAADDLHDPFWPSFFLAGDSACFDDHLAGHDKVGMDAGGGFFGEDGPTRHDTAQASSSLSSKPSLSSIDSGAAASSSPSLSALGALPAATISSSPHQQDPFAGGDDAAIMRAMMAVLSSASPSSSESSSPPAPSCRGDTTTQAAEQAVERQRGGGGHGHGHGTVRSSNVAVGPSESAASLASRQQQGDGGAAPGSSNSTQVYHMMSERKRREKLNDSFQTLRSLLPQFSKKDKTTVLINAASYLKTLEAEVSELEEKNAKLERHVPREDGGGATATAHRRAKVQISRAASEDEVNLTVMVMVECDIVDLVLRVLERLRWMAGVTVLSVDADTYSPQVLLKAIASIKLHITDGDCWNEASFREAMAEAVHDATTSSSSCGSAAPLVAAA